MPRKVTPEERFFAKVHKTQTCWLWIAYIDEDGYGRFRFDGKWGYAHLFLVGKAPDGLQWDHLCRVRRCVNPAHLDVVSPSENVQRGVRGRLKTRCANGHPWIPENIRVWGGKDAGRQSCLICERQRAEAQYAANGDKIRARARAHYYANREKKLAYQREYKRQKRANP